MKTSYFIAAFSAATITSCFKLPIPATPAARDVITPLPTQVPVPHRVTLGDASSKPVEQPLKVRQNQQQIPFQFCPKFFGRAPKLCSQCGGDSRISGTCDKILVSGQQSDCPPGGPYGGCLGYYCQCTDSGTDKSPQVTSTTAISGETGTVVWEPMTLTQYASLRAKTTVTLTEFASATSADEDELETVVAAVFAGGIAWWAASQSGAVGAALAIQPPSQPPDGSKEDDKTCPSNPNEECQNCGGADAVGLCKSDTEAGCPCDEVQHCRNEPPLCSDAACGGDNGKSQCSAKGNINGCVCCPNEPAQCPDSVCEGDASGGCQSAQRKGCLCVQVGSVDGPNIDPDDPVFPSPSDLSAIAAQVFTSACSANYNSVPWFTPSPKSTSCIFTSTVVPSSLQSIAGSGTQRFCQCGSTIAGMNLAVSGTVTTSYCALGSPVPTGYTQIPASNGLPITTPSPKPTTTPTRTPVPSPSSKSSSTSSCNFGWCGAPFCYPVCGPS